MEQVFWLLTSLYTLKSLNEPFTLVLNFEKANEHKKLVNIRKANSHPCD